MPQTLSILVVSLNEAAALPLQAAAIRALRLPPDTEVECILIDGGSTDGTLELAAKLGYKVLELPEASIPVCRNRALQESSGDWIAFLDADCAPCEEWLESAAPFLSQKQATMLGWPVVPPEDGSWVQRAWHAHWSNKNPALEPYEGQDVVLKDSFRLMTTRNMLFNRLVLQNVGGFDEELTTGEDTDFALRAYHRDVRVMGLPALECIHYGEPENLRAFFRQQVWHANRSSYLKILKESGGKTGGNAPLFTLVFLLTGLLAVAGVILAWITCPWFAIFCLPLPGLLGLLATRTAIRANQPILIPGLILLYGAYGVARSMDLLGLGRKKISWKRTGRT